MMKMKLFENIRGLTMLPLSKFRDMLSAYQQQMNEDMNELVNAADLVGGRPNYLVVDEHGYYHYQTSGTIAEVLASVEAITDKLKRIKAQRDKT